MSALPEDFIGRIIFILQNYGPSLLKGAWTTLVIALVGTIIGCIIGFIVGIIQAIPINKNDNLFKKIILRLLKTFLNIYVDKQKSGFILWVVFENISTV